MDVDDWVVIIINHLLFYGGTFWFFLLCPPFLKQNLFRIFCKKIIFFYLTTLATQLHQLCKDFMRNAPNIIELSLLSLFFFDLQLPSNFKLIFQCLVCINLLRISFSFSHVKRSKNEIIGFEILMYHGFLVGGGVVAGAALGSGVIIKSSFSVPPSK